MNIAQKIFSFKSMFQLKFALSSTVFFTRVFIYKKTMTNITEFKWSKKKRLIA